MSYEQTFILNKNLKMASFNCLICIDPLKKGGKERTVKDTKETSTMRTERLI